VSIQEYSQRGGMAFDARAHRVACSCHRRR